MKTMCITREDFEALLGPLAAFVVRNALRRIAIFDKLTDDQLETMRVRMVERSYSTGDVVIQQGEPGLELFAIIAGTAQVWMRKPNEEPNMVTELTPGMAFGERALLRNEPRKATIVATSPLQCFTISRDSFESALGQPLSRLVEQQWAE